jgi:hypothetical protein
LKKRFGPKIIIKYPPISVTSLLFRSPPSWRLRLRASAGLAIPAGRAGARCTHHIVPPAGVSAAAPRPCPLLRRELFRCGAASLSAAAPRVKRLWFSEADDLSRP